MALIAVVNDSEDNYIIDIIFSQSVFGVREPTPCLTLRFPENEYLRARSPTLRLAAPSSAERRVAAPRQPAAFPRAERKRIARITHMLIMNLPFAYDALVLPTYRHKILHEAVLRGYAPVEVTEVSLADLTPAIELLDGDAGITLYSYGGRLLRQARSVVTGEPLSRRDLETTLSDRYSKTASATGQIRTVFDSDFFPIGRGRSEFDWVREDGVGPMSRDPLLYESVNRDWPKPVVRSSTEDAESTWAKREYASAFVIADGLAYVQCPEPVWEARAWPLPRALGVNTAPRLFEARHAFRLDERHLAEAWCRVCGVTIDDVAPGAVLLDEGAPTRDTIGELAISCIEPARRRGLTAPGLYLESDEAKLLERFDGGGWALAKWEVPLLLDIVAQAYDLAIDDGTYDEERGDWRRLETIVQRWRFEKEHGRDLRAYAKFSEDDLAAIETIPHW